MIVNELRKIWDVKTAVLLIIVAGVLFYAWIIGQLNLNHLPLFETVEVTLGEELLRQYGTAIDNKELQQIEKLNEAAKKDLNDKEKNLYPQVKEFGFNSFNELETYCSNATDEMWEDEKFCSINDLYKKILEELQWEIEMISYYSELLARKDNVLTNTAALLDGASWVENKAIKRIRDIAKQKTISTLPPSIIMNMNYVIKSFGRILAYMALLFIIPYMVRDNKSRIYSIISTTKHGRNIIKTQIYSMMIAVIPLLLVCDIALYLIYRYYTQYYIFAQCKVEYLWFDLTFFQYFIIQMLICNLLVIALTLIFFFAFSFCNTFIGTIVMAIPCWGVGEVVMLHFMDKLFSCDIYRTQVTVLRFGVILLIALLFLIGFLCLYSLVEYRKKMDILF